MLQMHDARQALHCIGEANLAELLDLALCELLGAQGHMIPICPEAEVIWCVHQAVTIHNLQAQTCALLNQIN